MIQKDHHPSQVPQWVAAARQGDGEAWAKLHRHFAPSVHAVALARGDRQQADDIVQETFTRALERLGELRADDAFSGWLFAITRNLATSGLRRRRRFGAIVEGLLWFEPRPTAEARQAIEAIAALPEAYSELMMMRLVEGLTGPEIAERLERTPGSVRVSLHRGMALLRDRMGVTA